MELRVAAILGIVSAGLQLFIHLMYIVLRVAQSSRGMGSGTEFFYSALEGLGLIPTIGYLACFIFFLIGFNKLLAPATPEAPR